MNKQITIKQLVSTIAIIIFVIILIASFSGGSSNTDNKTIKQDDTEIIKQFRDEFMFGCNDGTNTAFCDCSFNTLHKEYGTSGLMSFAIKYENTGEFDERAIEAILKCL